MDNSPQATPPHRLDAFEAHQSPRAIDQLPSPIRQAGFNSLERYIKNKQLTCTEVFKCRNWLISCPKYGKEQILDYLGPFLSENTTCNTLAEYYIKEGKLDQGLKYLSQADSPEQALCQWLVIRTAQVHPKRPELIDQIIPYIDYQRPCSFRIFHNDRMIWDYKKNITSPTKVIPWWRK